MDRIDIFVEVPPVEYEKLVDEQNGENSAQVRQRIDVARKVQQDRFKDSSFLCNAEMGPAEVWSHCPLEEGARSLLQAATQQLNLSARAFHRILKVSRTIADLDGSEEIGVVHLAEALQYRHRGMR
jgi:magnesium chelatase family protein